MRRATLFAIPLVLLIAPPAHAGPALRAVHHWVSETHHENHHDYRRALRYHRGAETCAYPAEACRWRIAIRWHDHYLEALRQRPLAPPSPQAAIRRVFGGYGSQAVLVASCETGGTFDTDARNGQYHGLFQMGSHERATYGDSQTALGQAQAAYRYFRASGSDWSPWQCQP